MKQIKQLLMSILITFLICNYITAQGGNSFETAVQATFDTNNIADTSYMAQYYYFIPDFTGYVVIGNCGLPGFRGEVEVYDSLEVQINTIDYNCEYQTHVVIPVDSSVRYYICWTLSLIEEGETLNWYLNEYDPEPGELYQTAIPIEVGDTIDIIPIEYSSDIWYKIIPSDDKMISISSCNLGNNLYDIREISAFKDSVYNENIDRWSELEQNCTNGLYLDFPSVSGNVYYIRLSYLPEITTAKFTVNARDFESGEICELAEDVQANIEYTISSDQKYHWYTYTPEEDEYRVIGSTIINLSTLNLIIKNDCDCEPDYSTSGCMAVGSFGWAQQLDSAISYYFGWNNLFNESTSWCIYEPTRIIDFQICCQTEPTLIDNVNHTVEITVPDDQDVTNLVPEYVQAGNVEFIVNGESQYSGYDEQDFTNPVKYTVRYINPENNDTISQDWIVTVTKEGTPPGPYDVKSKYLKNPDLAKPLVSGFADFWKNAYDAEHGGFYSYVDREGNITDDIKTIVSQTQDEIGRAHV